MEEDKQMRRIKLLLGIFAVTVLVGGCATTNQTYDSSGKVAHMIKCGGVLQGWGSCYEKDERFLAEFFSTTVYPLPPHNVPAFS
jgi:hypothetical protein